MGNYSDYLKQTYGNSKGGSNTTPATSENKTKYSDYFRQNHVGTIERREVPSLASYTGGNATKNSSMENLPSTTDNGSKTSKIESIAMDMSNLVKNAYDKTNTPSVNIPSMSDEEIVKQYNSIPNYNAFERLFDKDKKQAYDTKQALSSDYQRIALENTNKALTDSGISRVEVGTALGNIKSASNPGEVKMQALKKLADSGVSYDDAKLWYDNWVEGRQNEAIKEFADENPVVASALSIPLNTAESLGNVASGVYNYATGKTIESNPTVASRLRANVSDDMGKAGQFLYGTAMSIGDMANALALASVTGGGSLVSSGLMGVEKASEVMNDAVNRGLTPNQIVAEGVASGVTTAITEKIPMGKWEEIASKGFTDKTIKGIAKTIWASAFPEAVQEMAEDGADALADLIIARGNAEMLSNIRERIANGEENAVASEIMDFVKQTALDGLGGFLSGGAMGTFSGLVGNGNAEVERIDSLNAQAEQNRLKAQAEAQAKADAQAEFEAQRKINQAKTDASFADLMATTREQMQQNDIARQNVAMQNRIAEEQNANKVPNLADLLAQANNVPQNVESNIASGTNEVPAQPLNVETETKAEAKSNYSTTNIGKDFKDYNDTINSLVNMFARSDEGKQAKADLKSAINEYAETKSPEARAKVENALTKLESEMKGKTYTTQRSSGKRSDKVKSYSYPTNYGTITENVQSVLDAIDGTNNLGSKIETPRVDNAFAENTVSAESKTSLQNYKEAMQAYKETNDVTYLEDATEFFNQAISELPEEMQNDLLEDFFDSYYNEADVMAEDIGLNPNTTDDVDIEPESITMEYDPAVDNLDMHVDTKRSKVSEMSMNTLENSGWFANTQESLDYIANERESGNHNVDVVREKESVETAERMLKEDYQGVIDTIIMSPEISNVQIDASAKIIQDLVAEAERTGDYSRVSSFTRTVIEKVHNAAQGLQALAKYTRTASGTFMKTEQLVQSGIKKFEKSAKGKKVAEKCTKLANALRMQGYDGTRDIPKVEKTHQQIVQGVINEFAKESSSVFADLTSNDYEYVARMVEGGMTAKEISQNIERKLVTGEWGMSTEDMNTIVDLFNKADKAGEFSKEAAEYQAEAYKIAAKYLPNKTFMEKWNAWRYLAMLGNPRTHIRNILGNFAFGTVTNIKDGIGALLESAYATMTGNDFERTKSLASRTLDKEMFAKAKTDFEKNAYTRATDEGHKYNMATEIERAQETYNVNTKAGQVLNKINDFNTDALSGEDTFAIRNKYERALVGYLKANGKDASIFSSDNQADLDLLERAREYAINEAKIATFHEDSKIADILNAWSRTARESGGVAGKGMEFALEAIMPFKKTPANILKQGVIEYNPAVQIPKAIAQTIKKGGNPADAINSYAKGLTGGSIVALGMWLASKGILRGGQKDDEDELLGEQEYSVNWDGKSYTIDWLAPAALPLFVGVELYNSNADEERNAFDALSSISEPIIEMSMLSGLRDTLNSVSSFSKSNNNLAQLGTSLASGYASQGIPTIGGQFARAFAENRKSTRPNAEGMLGTLEYQGRKAANKIPGLTNINEDYVNVWGEKEANTGGNFFGRLAYNMLSPGYYSSTERDNLKAELERLGKDDSVTTNVFPSKADNKYDGERLSTKEYNKYQEKKGQYYTKVANQLIQMPEYKKLTNEDKADVLHDLSLFTNALTKKELFGYDISASSTYKKQYQIYEEQGFKGVIDYLIGKKDKKEDSKSNSSSKKTTTIPGLYGSKK